MTEHTVAERMCRLLEEMGVSVLFGYPGGAILPFYDALHASPRLHHVLVRHEQAAAHAADGYARASGQVGVCVSTSGPGATNLVTGLATAMMDGVPIVAITGQVPRFGRGMDFFQETDVIGLTSSIAKHAFLLEEPASVDDVVSEAFFIATSGRPGPVVIDVPKDVQVARFAERVSTVRLPSRSTEPVEPNANTSRAITQAASILNDSKRPVILAGRGVVAAGMSNRMLRMAELADIPVATTLLGLDAIPATHPLSLGFAGMHGSERANRAIQEADVVLGLGARFDDRIVGRAEAFAPKARIIQADIEPSHMCRLVHPTLELIGDLRTTLPILGAKVFPRRNPSWMSAVRDRLREVHCEVDEPHLPEQRLTGRAVCRALARRAGETGAAVVTDVGQHQMLFAQEVIDAKPGALLTSGGLGTMGYALPAAIGAAIGCPDRTTWVVAGDGGFQMNLQELATVIQERIPLRIAIVNNGCLGMVRQWQELYHDRRYACSHISGPDMVILAKAYGIPARSVTEEGTLSAAIEWAESVRGPALLDMRVQQDENVFPMVKPGASLSEMQFGASQQAIA